MIDSPFKRMYITTNGPFKLHVYDNEHKFRGVIPGKYVLFKTVEKVREKLQRGLVYTNLHLVIV